MKNNILICTFREVFRHSRYIAFALIFSAMIGVGIVWLSSYHLIRFALTSNFFDWSARLKILWTSIGVFATNFTFVSQIMIIAVAISAGVNIAILIFYFKRTMMVRRASGASALGLVMGTLGVGCSACGSVVLSSLFGITTASVLVSWLPLRGVEFGIASLALIWGSIYMFARKIQSPVICAVKKRN